MYGASKMNPKSLDILILGLGRVGMTYDLKKPVGQVLTHTRAISEWAKGTRTTVNVVGIDPQPQTKAPFKEIFTSNEWYAYLSDLEIRRPFDLAIVATPISTIAQDVLQACQYLEIKKLVIEKPAAKNLAELETLVSIPGAKDNFIVGFPRPSLPSSIFLRDQIRMLGENEFWKVDIYYGGSVLNILSHFLNLTEFLFGPFQLDSFRFDSDNYLNAVFKSDSGKLSIHTHQHSESNNEKNEIYVKGPITICYTNSGRNISVGNLNEEATKSISKMNFQNEILQMIGNFGSRYLRWAALNEESEFTYLASTSLKQTIRLEEVAYGR
jgi:predicted dehydrogenase